VNASPRVLVVTPTLGESEFLERTVASVAAQSMDVRHVIAAPESKLPVMRMRFPGVQAVADAGRSGGIYGALNAALQGVNVDWDWFTYINDDDVLLPGFSRMFHRHVGTAGTEPVVYGTVELIDGNDRRVSEITVESRPQWIPALLQSGISPLMQQGTLFRRDIVRRLVGFDTRYRLCADLDFWLRALVGGAKFRHFPVPVAQFRVRIGQLSGDTGQTEREQAEIVSRLLPKPEPAWKKAAARLRYRVCNLPRYLERWRTRGFATSYDLLQTGGRAS
jgi:hypothetical protein